MKRSLLILALLSLPIFIWLFWQYSQTSETLSTTLNPFEKAGEETKKDLFRIPSLPVTEDENSFTMQDDDQTGLSITYANQTEENQLAPEKEEKDPLSLSFPKDQTKPIEIKLDKERIITIQDVKNQQGFTFKKINSDVVISTEDNLPVTRQGTKDAWYQKLFKKTNEETLPATYLTATNQRKTLLYTFQKDHATNEKKLKAWTLYQKGNGIEEEAYRFTNAKIKINDDGNAEVFYFGEKEIQNQQTQSDVEPSLLERAQRVIEKDMGEDILNSNKTPDFLIPKPFFYDKNGDIHETDWKYDEETKILSLQISTKDDLYPIALDPTLAFTAPAQSNTGWVIDGEGGIGAGFGISLVSGDFNTDGKTDLAVGSGYYNSSGRVYIFYNDGGIAPNSAAADVVLTGSATWLYFSHALIAGDFNADGKTDLAVGAYGFSGVEGRVYIFYNGFITETDAGADVKIVSEPTGGHYFGKYLTSGDFNADGTTDLAVGAYGYSTSAGRAYVFYNDGSIPTAAASADAIITGEASSSFGSALASGDWNADGKVDLTVGATGYSTSAGRAYIFYNGSIITESATGADIIITGEASSQLGTTVLGADLNADGKTDLVIGGQGYSSNSGRVYIFYGGSIATENASGADVFINGEGGYFGFALATGDLNSDGRTDLVVGPWYHNLAMGRVYVFYNDGSIPTTAATADVIITGAVITTYFGTAIATGDFNADGKVDLAVGSYFYNNNVGRAYIFTSQNGQVNTNVSLTGETTNDSFGKSLTSGDFNADGKTDLAVGAVGYSSDTGRVYLFYNDGSIPTIVASADVIITGGVSSLFGVHITSGDFDADGKIDLAAGSYGSGVYIFYNDGSYPTDAASADVIITGEEAYFGWYAMTSGDFDADGTTDLAVGGVYHSSWTGRVYLFYNDGSLPTTATTADVIIDGETGSYFGTSLASGDFDADGTTDLAVGANVYSTSTGRAYLFYNDSSIPTTAASADVIITGEGINNEFGRSLTSGDFNADGKTDLAVGAYSYSTSTGRAYLFYNDSSIPTAAASADVLITGEAIADRFGFALISGDFNADSKTDLAVGAYTYSSNSNHGNTYLFYNDGSIPTTAATADVRITGETTNNYFGYALTSGDFNADGKIDLAVGAYGYSTSTGRVYLYETRDNFAWQLQSQSSLSGGLRTNPSFSGQVLKVTGEIGTGKFGAVMTPGDWNADGKTDLAVGASNYSTNTGRVYLFYNDGSLPAAAISADVVITGEATSDYFGTSLTSGDFNADGKADLAVGAYGYSTNTGRAYIFYNDSSIPITAVTADIIITGETTSDYFGNSFVSGDFNADGTTDLAVGAYGYSSAAGRAYIFYNDSSIPITAASADILITGEAASSFGLSLAAGDWNADGTTDLAVGAYGYSSAAGRAYIFYNGSIITENASGADIIITGEATVNLLGYSLAAGDWNADGKTDLAVGAENHGFGSGRVYIFYNGSIITENASGADIIITGEAIGNLLGASLTSGDWNADGKTDLAVGAFGYSSSTGRVYIFYNGSIITENASGADIIITGEASSSSGASLASGDFNADGKIDFAVGAPSYSSSLGRIYLYTFNDGVITGETTSNYFGYALTSGDFNADGKIDLAVGAFGYSTDTGRVYLFYNDGSIPNTAATADIIITGETTNNSFGRSLTSGDWNTDGKTDLAVGAEGYSTNTGRAYLFYNGSIITENASGADIIITGEASSSFGRIDGASADVNADGKTDLVVGAYGYSTDTGRAYIFYNGSIITENASGADVIITGETTNNYFGRTFNFGDFNADGKTDLVIGAYRWNNFSGRVYIFYNDGNIPTTAATADVIITGEAFASFGRLSSGDWNADGKTDLAVGADGYSTNTGRAYIFYNDGSIPTTSASADVIITGEASSNFGIRLTAGDFNVDGKTDLAVGAFGYSTNTGRAYIFYNDGSIPTTAATADVIITGETTSNYFGFSLIPGDFNVDGKTDLAVGAYLYSTNTGRTYIFITEAKVEESLPQFQSIGTTNIIGNFEVR